MNKEAKPYITKVDNKLFLYLEIFKYVDLEFAKKYIYTDKADSTVRNRLNQLHYHKYITRFYMYKKSINNEQVRSVIFALDEVGKDFLDFNLHKPQIGQSNIFYEHYVAHQLFLANALVNFFEAKKSTASGEVYVEKLVSESELSVVGKYNNLRPDAGIIVNVKNNRFLYFVEAERSYASTLNLSRKIQRQYNNLIKNKNKLEIIEQEDIVHVRVLFISENNSKMKNIISKIKSFDENLDIDILFTTIQRIENAVETGEGVLSNIYSSLDKDFIYLTSKL